MYSLGASHFNAMIPSDMYYQVWNAHGNQATCTAIGFFSILGITLSMGYNASLNVYSLAIVKYNKTDNYIRAKMEPFLHGVPIFFALAFSFGLLFSNGYNASVGRTCVEAVYNPPHCYGFENGEVREGFVIPCGRGRGGPSWIIFYMVFAYDFFITPVVVGVTLGMMYKHVSRQEGRMTRYGAGAFNQNAPQEDSDAPDGNNRSIRSSMRNTVTSLSTGWSARRSARRSTITASSTSRVVFVRARAYTIAYVVTWSWYIIIILMRAAGVGETTTMSYLATIFSPFQGFWNLAIFVYPKMMKARRGNGGNTSWCQAFTEVFCPAMNRWRERRAARNDEKETPQDEKGKPDIANGETEMTMTTNSVMASSVMANSGRMDVRPGSEEEKTEIEA